MFDKKLRVMRRAEPFNLLRQMTAELDRVFDEPWGLFAWPAPVNAKDVAWAPKVDLLTNDNTLIARVDLPGMKKDDVRVELQDGLLTLSGERRKETKHEDDSVYREEREYGSFCRTIPLPAGVAMDDVKATFADGVLEVKVPLPVKVKPEAKTIAITDGAAPSKTAA